MFEVLKEKVGGLGRAKVAVLAVIGASIIGLAAVVGSTSIQAHDPDQPEATPIVVSTEVVLHESEDRLCVDVTNFATLAAEVHANNGINTVSESGRESISDTTKHCVDIRMKVTADAGVSLTFSK